MSKNNFSNKLNGFINLFRPFTLLAPLIVTTCIMSASYFYNIKNGDFNISFWNIILPASMSLAMLNAGSNALNQATDVNSDKLSKPYRPIPKGDISIREAKIISIFMYLISIYLAFTINYIFSIFVLLISFFTITYSLPPRLKNKLFINQIWVAIPRGFLGILASWSVFGDVLQPLPITIGSIAMFFLIGGSITKDIIDREADKDTGTKTMINTYGIKKSAFFALPFMFFPFVMIPLFITEGILDSQLWSLTFLAIPSYLIFYSMIRDKPKSKFLENTSAWSLMYLTYFIFALSFSVLTIAASFNI